MFVLRAVTVAPATVAPVLSVTVPSNVAVVYCADARCVKNTPKTATTNNKHCLSFIASSENVPLTEKGMFSLLPYHNMGRHPTSKPDPKNARLSPGT